MTSSTRPTSALHRAESVYSRFRARVINGVEGLNDELFAYLLLAPTFLILGAMAFYPLLGTFEMSLRADNIASADAMGSFIGLDNYVEILTGQRDAALPRPFIDLSNPFQSILLATLIFTLVSVFFEGVIGYGQALVLNEDFRGRRWARVAILLPWAVPIAIQGMIFYLLFVPGIGIGTDFLRSIGVFSATPLRNSAESMFVVIVADVWKTAPFIALIVLAGLQSVDRSLYDVAKVSGASPWQRFKLITFPIVLPALLVALLFRTLEAMKVFGVIETISSCTTVPSLTCMVVSTFHSGRFGTSGAIAFIMAAIVGIVVFGYIVKFMQTANIGES